VAFKEIQPRFADDASRRGRFILEAEVTGALEHPGIVPIYALGYGGDRRPFYAMRFIKGDSLEQVIADFHNPQKSNLQQAGSREIGLRNLLGRFIDVCNAVDYAHSRGVLHRDLKPANIMLGDFGETLVVDWGLAKVIGRPETVASHLPQLPVSAQSQSDETQPGSVIGTPVYMSPEQASGQVDEIGPRSDIYGLGATLINCLRDVRRLKIRPSKSLWLTCVRDAFRSPEQYCGKFRALWKRSA